MKPFSEYSQAANSLLAQLRQIQDNLCFYKVVPSDADNFTVIATLATDNDTVNIVYDYAMNGDPMHSLKEIPPHVMAEFGEWIGKVEAWKNGAEFDRSIRDDVDPL